MILSPVGRLPTFCDALAISGAAGAVGVMGSDATLLTADFLRNRFDIGSKNHITNDIKKKKPNHAAIAHCTHLVCAQSKVCEIACCGVIASTTHKKIGGRQLIVANIHMATTLLVRGDMLANLQLSGRPGMALPLEGEDRHAGLSAGSYSHRSR